MKADLHVHSYYSDGSDSVASILQKAAQANVTHISFVDHDTIAGWEEIHSESKAVDIIAIPGIEISAYDFKRNRKVHVLGYNFHRDAVHIQSICQPLLERRHAQSLWQIKQLKLAGYSLDTDRIIESAKHSGTVYKQHIMKELTEQPFTSAAYQKLYKDLFKGHGVAAGDIEYIDVFDAVRAIKLDGGLAVVAHPGQLDSYDLIPELVEVGLDGIERNHFDHTAEDISRVEELAEKYQLVMTGGTDFHGAFGSDIAVGDIVSPSCTTVKV
ncbi:phosphatase [Sporosarcina sp. P13]|uniref:PHP domain-containing protein n=1 Tax=Sporosarcina sp. P13 TaxID=2048263 RepID=UPI000C16C1D2|nr:PHP domain-containing protein [Sporosarcina sp. P13]PIC64185.1 phosphatase [Sporosarcina sp. P13]